MAVAANEAPVPDRVTARRALLSVFDKTGLVDFARGLADLGIELVSTGGTKRALAEAGLRVADVSDLTGFPEIMDGRVKTLHPLIHGGLLGVRDDPAHAAAMEAHGIRPIDILVVSLYPFAEVRASGAPFGSVLENIDIGGPAMIRAAAKNHSYLAVATDPADYAEILEALRANGGAAETGLALRRRLGARAFAATAAYDAGVAEWLGTEAGETSARQASFAGKLVERLRYGENPHQDAAFFATGEKRPGVATARQVQGKALSYNNINDTDAAFECVAEFDPNRTAAVAIIKHANPCGVAEGTDLLDAYAKALACDPVSAFGGIVAVNRVLDAAAARAIVEVFTEVIVAPGADDEAMEIVKAKKNLRLLLTGGLPDPRALGATVRSVAGGLLVQGRDNGVVDDLDLKVVTKREPTAAEMSDLKFAFRVAKHVKSNAIVYAKDRATVGIGAGQMSRVDSARIAARKAEDAARALVAEAQGREMAAGQGAAGEIRPLTVGSVVASDAFFPFADGLLSAVEAGATAVIQPGGSMRDTEVIAAADAHGIAMVLTGMRHFRH
ncbi:bifunctional phosphoribosylaminoimidazolecarboxamide formyltransferase/IMP cyclohydrolase [Aureimonas leprariae]|uniref:Bifunctional purine biosynthesis protein PurH n=1 Tax=Plantimonas leprariae TaxID=2615207 RepID=A0A7V7PNN9_9HYPH|nr:bifunctional phosphoribosylaminoimidazolecarboxamide formyltransferase/IMP cyclohydrolase [Aureimonas leprariae]KAB0679376.1 bifunctional phosphoribosylaminoimidazolecarboxamide formyltransferase/IMP cyclohydrolase [Aureimonas leprariae]